jgi:hypothetical protein
VNVLACLCGNPLEVDVFLGSQHSNYTTYTPCLQELDMSARGMIRCMAQGKRIRGKR